MSRGKRIALAAAALVFLCGLGLYSYPYVHGKLLESAQARSVRGFYAWQPERHSSSLAGVMETVPYAGLLDAARQYNEDLYAQAQGCLDSSEDYEEAVLALGDYGLDTNVFAVLKIPAIDLEMPIFLGASRENLAEGAAHMGQTSLPIGGENTNAVIAGHRGWRGADYFLRITDLEPGDEVLVDTLWGRLRYTVEEKKTILPSDSESILIQPGRDLLTLLSCEYGPNGVRNRWIVICRREERAGHMG